MSFWIVFFTVTGVFLVTFLVMGFIVYINNGSSDKAFIRSLHRKTGTTEQRNEKRKSAEASTGRKLHVNLQVPFDDSPEAGEIITMQAEIFDPQIAEYFKAEVRFNDKMLEIQPEGIVLSYEEISIIKYGLFNEWNTACFIHTLGQAVLVIHFDDLLSTYKPLFKRVAKFSSVAYKSAPESITVEDIAGAALKVAAVAGVGAVVEEISSNIHSGSSDSSSDSGFGGGSGHGGGAGRR